MSWWYTIYLVLGVFMSILLADLGYGVSTYQFWLFVIVYALSYSCGYGHCYYNNKKKK